MFWTVVLLAGLLLGWSVPAGAQLTPNVVPKTTATPGRLTDSLLTDDGTTLTYPGAGGLVIGGIQFSIGGPEGSAGSCPTPTAGKDFMCADAATHQLLCSFNGVAYATCGGSGGTVSSVALSLPSQAFTISGSPIISSGTLTAVPHVENVVGNITGSTTINWNNGVTQAATMTGNVTLSFSNPVNGAWYTLRLAQDATGSRTVTWPGGVVWVNSTPPTVNGTAGGVTEVIFHYDGTNYQASTHQFVNHVGGHCSVTVAPGTNVIQAAIDGLPTAGGTVCLGAGTYTQTGGNYITLGNGTSSGFSTRHGIQLIGAVAPVTALNNTYTVSAATTIDCSATTTGDCIKILGVEGWGLRNLKLTGATSGSTANAITITSSRLGTAKDIYINTFKGGVLSNTWTGGAVNPAGNDSIFNTFEGLYITGVTGTGIYFTGDSSHPGGTFAADTDFNIVRNVYQQPAASSTCLRLGFSDNNVFENTTCTGGTVTGINFDYSAGASSGPSANMFMGLEVGSSSIINTGTPSGAGTTPNIIYGFSETNGAVPPNLANLSVVGASRSYVDSVTVRGGVTIPAQAAISGTKCAQFDTSGNLAAGANPCAGLGPAGAIGDVQVKGVGDFAATSNFNYDTTSDTLRAGASTGVGVVSTLDVSGTNTAGGQVYVSGGRGTGNATGGSVKIAVGTTGSSGTTVNDVREIGRWDAAGQHLESTGTAPVVTNTTSNSCGLTAASIVGTDQAGKVTTGGTSATSCTVTFALAWTQEPSCFCTNETTGVLCSAKSTQTTVILTGTLGGASVVSYGCLGRY